MGKRSKKRRAKQKLLQQQQFFTHVHQEESSVEADEGEILRTTKPINPRVIMKIRKFIPYVLMSLVIFLGFFGVYKMATRPLPGTLIPDLGNEHISAADTPHEPYNSKPPTSGPHLDPKAEWGIHDQQITNELQIHNLEDGGVLIQYDCDEEDCSTLIQQLETIAKRYKEKVILAPYANLDQRIALTAWNRIDTFDEFDEKRITTFINFYRGIDHHKR
jgi:hypothetical protein